MKVTRQEIDALVGVLDYYMPDLRAEIARTDHDGLRERLGAQAVRLADLRQRLLDARELSYDEDELRLS